MITLAVTIAGTVGTYLAIPNDEEPEPTASEPVSISPVVEDSTDPEEEEAPDPAVDALTPGTCLSAEATASPCDVPPAKEVYAVAPDCSHAGLMAFLGGVADQDVLRADLALTEQPDGACVVELPADTSLTRSLRGVLADDLTGDRSPWLRRCFDARSQQDVDCGSHHTGEYVWERQRDSLETIDCSARAGDYLGTSIGPLFRTLALEDLSTSATELCRISVKGSNSLDGSIRNIASTAIPLAAS